MPYSRGISPWQVSVRVCSRYVFWPRNGRGFCVHSTSVFGEELLVFSRNSAGQSWRGTMTVPQFPKNWHAHSWHGLHAETTSKTTMAAMVRISRTEMVLIHAEKPWQKVPLVLALPRGKPRAFQSEIFRSDGPRVWTYPKGMFTWMFFHAEIYSAEKKHVNCFTWM